MIRLLLVMLGRRIRNGPQVAHRAAGAVGQTEAHVEARVDVDAFDAVFGGRSFVVADRPSVVTRGWECPCRRCPGCGSPRGDKPHPSAGKASCAVCGESWAVFVGPFPGLCAASGIEAELHELFDDDVARVREGRAW